MPMEAGEHRRFRKTVTLRTASIKRPPKERQVRCTPQMGVRLMVRRVSTATVLPWARPRMVTSTRLLMGTRTKILGADGAETRTILRDTTVPVTRTPRNPAHQVGEDRKKAVDHRPSAAEA